MNQLMYKRGTRQRGALLVLVIVFSSIFFVMVTGLLGYVITQYQSQEVRVQKDLAREIAEAGLNYYKWFLAHYPGDVTHGTGDAGPFTIPFEDPELGRIGEFEVALNSSAYCGAVSSIDITSTGRTDVMSHVERTVYARYARPTVAEYAYIINSNVWVGPDTEIIGPYHTNGGVRFDGTNNSTVSSQQETWSCTATYGCTPTRTQPGVYTETSNANAALFSFPSVPINFTGLTVNLATMRTRAMSNGGIHIGPSGGQGYEINFLSNGTFNLYRINSTVSHRGMYNDGVDNIWQTERNIINGRTLIANHTIPADCPLIFIEDKVWISGEVNQKVTLAAANLSGSGEQRSVILQGNLTYANEGSGLLVIGQQDVLIGVNVPNDMTISGIFIAQNGRFGRNFYCGTGSGCSAGDLLPSSYRSYAFRNSLTMLGTIVSNGRVGTKWTNGGNWVSAFNDRYNSYDRNLVDNPPPLTPHTSDDYAFVEWRDMYQ